MPVIIQGQNTPPSNKPPAPQPLPSSSLFPTQKTLSDGRTIWISVPQPDRLTLVIPVSEKIYKKGIPSSVAVPDFLHKFGLYLKEEPFNAHHVKSYFHPDSGWRFVTLTMGKRGSFVRFDFLNDKKYGRRLRIELNPRKLGPAGFAQLANVLGGPNAPLDLPQTIKQARVTRLDIAVDIVGVEVGEVLVRHKDQGKRSHYVGTDGVLETLFVHRKLKSKQPKVDQYGFPKKLSHGKKPAGKVLLRIYDRVRERVALLRPPPFGPAPVVRVELTLDRFVKWAPFPKLGAMDDPFQKVRVGFRDTQVKSPSSRWQQYIGLRRTMGLDAASALLDLQSLATIKFELAKQVPEADLVAPETTWEGWAAGLKETGLALLLSAGE